MDVPGSSRKCQEQEKSNDSDDFSSKSQTSAVFGNTVKTIEYSLEPDSQEQVEETSVIAGLAAGKRRETIIVVVALSVVVLLTATPFISYIWKPAKHLNEAEDYQQTQCGPFSFDTLRSSVCSQYLSWVPGIQSQAAVNTTKLKQWNCTKSEVENNLKQIFSLVSVKCVEEVKPLLCSSVYRPCEGYPVGVTQEDCKNVRDNYCQKEWLNAEKYLTKENNFCITLPKCEDFPSTGNSSAQLKKKVSAMTTNRSCPSPLIPSNSSTGPCSPKCFSNDWSSEEERMSLRVILYITVIFSWICLGVLITTWIAVPSLTKFPQNIIVFMTLFFSIAVIGLSLPLFVGRKEAYCNHPDAFAVWDDPSTLCQIQGIMVHFGVVSGMLWWLCSVFNVFVSVRCVSIENPIKSHMKLVFVSELLLSVGIPVILVGIVIASKDHYVTNSIDIISCSPPTEDLLYLTLSLPLQITIFAGITMVVLIILRLRKSSKIFVENRSATMRSVYRCLQQRFLLLAILCPFSYSVMMTSIAIFSRLSSHILKDYLQYIHCLGSPEKLGCESPFRKYRPILFAIIDLVMFGLFSFTMCSYALAPRAAREFWEKKWKSTKRASGILFGRTKRLSIPQVFVSNSTETADVETRQRTSQF
eukprot:m.6351 g.6351  ORF g.6351 m.6351 type:complete len:640 (+) comp15653_c0_seq1:530-2449(+)